MTLAARQRKKNRADNLHFAKLFRLSVAVVLAELREQRVERHRKAYDHPQDPGHQEMRLVVERLRTKLRHVRAGRTSSSASSKDEISPPAVEGSRESKSGLPKRKTNDVLESEAKEPPKPSPTLEASRIIDSNTQNVAREGPPKRRPTALVYPPKLDETGLQDNSENLVAREQPLTPTAVPPEVTDHNSLKTNGAYYPRRKMSAVLSVYEPARGKASSIDQRQILTPRGSPPTLPSKPDVNTICDFIQQLDLEAEEPSRKRASGVFSINVFRKIREIVVLIGTEMHRALQDFPDFTCSGNMAQKYRLAKKVETNSMATPRTRPRRILPESSRSRNPAVLVQNALL